MAEQGRGDMAQGCPAKARALNHHKTSKLDQSTSLYGELTYSMTEIKTKCFLKMQSQIQKPDQQLSLALAALSWLTGL